MSSVDSVLRALLETMRKLRDDDRPSLKSVTMNPLDYNELRDHAAVKATVPDGAGTFLPLTVRGVAVYQSPWVPRGKPWYDPPEAGPRTPHPMPEGSK